MVERILGNPGAELSRFKLAIARATEIIRTHPISAAASALGLGYLLVRIVRR